MKTLEKHSLELPSGSWSWFEAGEGRALVLLPGFGDSKKTFVRLGRDLAERFRVILPEVPGFGESPPMEPAQYRLSLQVDRLFQFLQHLNLKRPIVGGNSSGGQIAALYGLKHSPDCAGLVLLAPQGMADEHFAPYSHKPNPPQGAQDFLENLQALYHQPPQLDEQRLSELAQRSAQRWDFLNQIRAQIRSEGDHQLNGRLAELKVPALVLWGRSDGRIPPRLGELWAQASVQVQLHWLENCGHLPQLEAREETARWITAFGTNL